MRATAALTEGGTVIQVSASIFHSRCLPCPKILPLLVTPCKALLVAHANGQFQCDVGISLLCLTAVVSSCRVSLMDSLGRLDGDQQHWHHQQHVPDSSAPMWLCRGEVKHHVAACERHDSSASSWGNASKDVRSRSLGSPRRAYKIFLQYNRAAISTVH